MSEDTVEELKLKLEAAEARAIAAEELVDRAKREIVELISRSSAGNGSGDSDDARVGALEKRLLEVSHAYERLQEESEALQSSHGQLKSRIDTWKKNFFDAELRAFRAELGLKGVIEQFQSHNPQLQRLAYEDPITGLANQNVLDRFLEVTSERVNEGRETAALMAIDLDRFSIVNDLVGWEAGDKILRQVAERLQQLFGDKVALGRRGEDEFTAVLTMPADTKDALGVENVRHMSRQYVSKILEVIRKPFVLEKDSVYLTCSVGISLSPGDADSASEMQDHARAALRVAKEHGRDQYKVFEERLQERLENEAAWEAELRVAVAEDKIRYLFRPIVSVERGVMVAADMVVLWDHPIDGTLYLSQFLDTADRNGCIVPILERAFEWACHLAKKLRSVPVFFPLSLRMIRQAGLAEGLLKKVTANRARAEQLVAEIPPQALAADPERSYQVAEELSRWGMKLAIPYIGTAETSLWHLKTNPAEFLKMDPSMMQGVPLDANTTPVAKATIGVARELGKKLIADGVEDHQKGAFLRAQACEFGVGRLFSPPLVLDELVKLRRKSWTI